MSEKFHMVCLWWSDFASNYVFGIQQLWQQDTGDKIIIALHSTLPPMFVEVVDFSLLLTMIVLYP